MRRGVAVVVAVVVVLLGGTAAGWFLAGPGTSGAAQPAPSPSTSTTSSAAAQAQVKRNWEQFFHSGTPVSRRVALLQNGARFRSAIEALASSPVARGVSAKVTQVRMTTPTTAKVTYDIDLNGNPVLTHRTGTAVLAAGTWQVSDAAFCELIGLSGNRPPACPSASASAAPTGTGGSS